jgi:hypothetical protein
MNHDRLRRSALVIATVTNGLLASMSGTFGDAVSNLNDAWRTAYEHAAKQTLSNLRASVPVLVNRFDQIALYRPGMDRPDLFSMDPTIYREAKSVAHTPAALYVRLAASGLGTLDEARLQWLAAYQSLLSDAEAEIGGRADIPAQIRAMQTGMLADVPRFAQRIQQRGTVDQAILDEMGSLVRNAVRKNLELAAASQLEQFRDQIGKWKADYPSLAWDRAVVVTIGVHQARERYLQRQFFDWMLRDDPRTQDRVVFAETMTPPPLEKADDALMLLSKVMLDKGLSEVIFDDRLRLQADVLGDAAEAVIKNWH